MKVKEQNRERNSVSFYQFFYAFISAKTEHKVWLTLLLLLVFSTRCQPLIYLAQSFSGEPWHSFSDYCLTWRIQVHLSAWKMFQTAEGTVTVPIRPVLHDHKSLSIGCVLTPCQFKHSSARGREREPVHNVWESCACQTVCKYCIVSNKTIFFLRNTSEKRVCLIFRV